MRRTLTALTVVSILVALALTAGGAASGSGLRASGSKPKTKTVTLGDDFFSPGKVTVKKGTVVKWVWQNGQTDHTHTVTEEMGSFTSKETDVGTYKHKFKKAGKFKIVCATHPDMTMKVTVKK